MATSGSPKALSRPPTISHDSNLDALLKTKLRLEAEVEAIREAPAAALPEGDRLALAQASVEADANDLHRTLAYFKQQNATLAQEDARLTKTLEQCTPIVDALNGALEGSVTSAEGADVAIRLKGLSAVFKVMRQTLRKLFDDINEKHPEKRVNDALQSLSNRMLDFPNDPYVELAELNCTDEALTFLLVHNLVQRHTYYPSKIRLLDPRT